MTVFWVVWDGAAQWVVDELIARASLPRAAILRKAGISGGLKPSSPNCQTPPGLATLFTGTPPALNGITGFWVPGAITGDMATSTAAFTPGVCQVPMIWDSLGAAGASSLLIHAPWSFDEGGSVSPYAAGAVEAYSRRVSRERASLVDVGEVVTWDDLGSPVTISQRSPSEDEVVLGSPGTAPLVVGSTWTVYAPKDGHAAWYRTIKQEAGAIWCVRTGAWSPLVAGYDPYTVKRLEHASSLQPFVGDSMGSLFRNGVYGPRLVDGGTGSAEEILLSGAQLVADSFRMVTESALAGEDLPDLVVVYCPVTDDIGHELVGLLDPAAKDVADDIRERAWDMVGRGYCLADELLGVILDRASADDTVILSSDHGMAPVSSTFYPNNLLVQSGFAIPCEDGNDGADPTLSAVWYHLASNGLLLLNTNYMGPAVGRTGETAMAGAMRVLKEARCPSTGAPAVLRFVDEWGTEISNQALAPESVYAVFSPGILPWPDVTERRETFGPPLRSAAHTTYNGDVRLHAAFAARGPDFRSDMVSEPLVHNEQVSSVVRKVIEHSLAGRPDGPGNRSKQQTRLSVIGPSGAGKSTFFEIASEFCASRNLRLARLKLAQPLYDLQQAVRDAAGLEIPVDLQDQVLMESLAYHLRRLNPRALVQPFIDSLRNETAELVINDDLRDHNVDYPELQKHQFIFIRIEVDELTRQSRLKVRGDATLSDTSTAYLHRIPTSFTVANNGGAEEYKRRVTKILEVLIDS